MAACLADHFADARVDPAGMAMLALGVFVVYTGDRLIEHGQGWSKAAVRGLWAATGVACVALAVLALSQGARLTTVAGLGAVCIAYPWLKATWVLKTLVVVAAWVVGALGLALTPLPWDAMWRPAALGFAAAVAAGALLCDLKDVVRDAAQGVRTLPVSIGEGGARAIAALLAVAGAAVAGADGCFTIAACNSLMLLASAFPALLRRSIVGPLLVDTLLLVPAIALAW